VTRATAIIPARMGSTRLPGKALLDRTGTPLVVHVCDAASRSALVERVVVACDDVSIRDAVVDAGFESVLTDSGHENGTSRLAEAAEMLGLDPGHVIVNVQGDEPEIDPGVIDAAIDGLDGNDASMATVASPFAPGEDPSDPNIVKVVAGLDARALYFSRARIPHTRDRQSVDGRDAPIVIPLKHVGIYVYRRSFLEVYASLDPTPLERTERLEQLRVLEHGHSIAVVVRETHHHGIDTPEQYDEFVERWNRRQSHELPPRGHGA